MNPLHLIGSMMGKFKVASYLVLGLSFFILVPLIFKIVFRIVAFTLVLALISLPWLVFRSLSRKRVSKTPQLALAQPVFVPVVTPIKPLPSLRPRFALIRAFGEVFCGTIIGVVLGALSNWQAPGMVSSAMLGATIGTVAGFVVGFMDGETKPRVVEGEHA